MLVSTSVVEVGIDVPNASVILIENANRFGLAQLHQFRGRVGRGEHPSFCLLIAGIATREADQRLQAMEETTDGFKLAEIDWEMRGAGDLLGLQQSGSGRFRLAELMNPHLVELAQREARTVYAEDPNLTSPEHHLLAQRVQVLLGPARGRQLSYQKRKRIIMRQDHICCAIYPGSFNPVHYGHIDIAQRALRMFDEVIIAVYVHPGKPRSVQRRRTDGADSRSAQR